MLDFKAIPNQSDSLDQGVKRGRRVLKWTAKRGLSVQNGRGLGSLGRHLDPERTCHSKALRRLYTYESYRVLHHFPTEVPDDVQR